MFEKWSTEPKPNLLWCKNIVNITTFNNRNLNTINQLHELTVSVAEHSVDIVCMQKQRYYNSELDLNTMIPVMGRHSFVSAFAWINSVGGGIGMLLSRRALKSLNSIEKTQPRIICAAFNGNPCTAIVSYYCPTKANDETNITIFHDGLSYLAWYIPKHNVLIIDGDINK